MACQYRVVASLDFLRKDKLGIQISGSFQLAEFIFEETHTKAPPQPRAKLAISKHGGTLLEPASNECNLPKRPIGGIILHSSGANRFIQVLPHTSPSPNQHMLQGRVARAHSSKKSQTPHWPRGATHSLLPRFPPDASRAGLHLLDTRKTVAFRYMVFSVHRAAALLLASRFSASSANSSR